MTQGAATWQRQYFRFGKRSSGSKMKFWEPFPGKSKDTDCCDVTVAVANGYKFH